MKALRFQRKPARFAAAAVAGRMRAGAGAAVGPLRLADVDPPTLPADGWVEVKPRLAGICGSDLSMIDGHTSLYFEPITSLPFTPGHEVVADTPHGRAVLVPVLACATRGIDPPCPECAAGRPNLCERTAFGHLEPGLQSGFCESTGGGWSTRMVAHDSQLVAVPDDLSDEAAVMVEPTACAVHAARTLAPGPVVVLGAGTLGLLTLAATAWLRSRPGTPADDGPLVAVAKYPHQRDLARRLGAHRVAAPGELERVVRSLSGSFVLDSGQLTGGCAQVVDCVGSASSVAQSLRTVAPGGTVHLVGMAGRTDVDLTPLWHREAALRGCYAYTRDDFDTALEVVRDLDLGRLVSATYPLDRYHEAIDHAASAGPRGAVKVAFDLRNEKERNR